jgi:hypothetical protein
MLKSVVLGQSVAIVGDVIRHSSGCCHYKPLIKKKKQKPRDF